MAYANNISVFIRSVKQFFKLFSKHNKIKNLTAGMTEQEVISILGSEPIHRFDSENGEYSLQWMHMRIGIGTSKASGVIIDFSSDSKMIRVADSDIAKTP